MIPMHHIHKQIYHLFDIQDLLLIYFWLTFAALLLLFVSHVRIRRGNRDPAASIRLSVYQSHWEQRQTQEPQRFHKLLMDG